MGLLLEIGSFVATAAAGAAPVYRIAVVDIFSIPTEVDTVQSRLIAADAADIDGDGLRDTIYHGDLVSLYVRSDGIETVPFPVHDNGNTKEQLLARLLEIRARHAAGTLLDGVMFCWESSTLISAIADTLCPANRCTYQEIIRSWGDDDESWRLTYEIIQALQRLAEDGLFVVTIAGNSGPAWVNTYTFAEGVIVVGAVERDLDGEWAACNSLIDTYAKSSYTVRLVGETDRPVYGYDIDEDGVMDIDLRRGSSFFRRYGTPRETHRILKGTSFAAPTALKGMLAREGGVPMTVR